MPEGENNYLKNLKAELAGIEERGRKAIREEKSAHIREEREVVINKQEQLAFLIAEIYKIVYERAGTNSTDIINKLIKSHELTHGQLHPDVSKALAIAINEFGKKHEISASYFKKYSNKPDEFFELCFGKKPVGKVEILPGPMTICVRCYSDDDYVFAYNHSKHVDENTISHNERSKALKSQGAAFSFVKDKQLDGVVVMERLGNNLKTVDVEKEFITELSKNQEVALQVKDLHNDVWLGINGKVPYRFNFTFYKGKIETVGLFDNELGDFILYSQTPPFEYTLNLPGNRAKNSDYITIKVGVDGINFYNHSRNEAEFKFEKAVARKQVVKDEALSKEIRRHEERHQFNKLFVPKENLWEIGRVYINKLNDELLNPIPEEVEKAKRKLIRAFVLHYRRMYIDSRLRDEIIAFYSGGGNLDSAAVSLVSSELYDYKNQVFSKVNGKSKTYKDQIIEYIFDVLGRGEKTRNIEYRTRDSDNAVAFDKNKNDWLISFALKTPIKANEFTPQLISEVVNEVLGPEYDVYVNRLMEAIKTLQKNGYKKDQILAFMNMFPIRSWQNFVGKLARKYKWPKEEKTQAI